MYPPTNDFKCFIRHLDSSLSLFLFLTYMYARTWHFNILISLALIQLCYRRKLPWKWERFLKHKKPFATSLVLLFDHETLDLTKSVKPYWCLLMKCCTVLWLSMTQVIVGVWQECCASLIIFSTAAWLWLPFSNWEHCGVVRVLLVCDPGRFPRVNAPLSLRFNALIGRVSHFELYCVTAQLINSW